MKILLVDDDKNIRKTLELSLRAVKHEVHAVASAETAITRLKEERFDFVLTDFRLEGKSGLEVVKAAQHSRGSPLTVIMTAFASFENAVAAIKQGAYDYIPKPFSMAQLGHIVSRVESFNALRKENDELRRKHSSVDFFSGLTSPAAQRLAEFVSKVAPTHSHVLLVGESGCGMSEIARRIHAQSPRSSRPFVVLNCAIHREAIQSELNAVGTLLIEEINELGAEGQLELLGALERFSEKPEPDLRVIAATHGSLEEAVSEGRFREDLYYRLNKLECQVVPLRHRKEDVPVLIQNLLLESGVKTVIPSDIMKRLMDYSWPGNLRELRNTVERLVLLSAGREMKLEDLPDSVKSGNSKRTSVAADPLRSLEEVEKEQIQRVLAIESNQERAAEILGITSVTLWRKRKQYGLP